VLNNESLITSRDGACAQLAPSDGQPSTVSGLILVQGTSRLGPDPPCVGTTCIPAKVSLRPNQ
jgi:hypothetical protein